MATLAIKSGTTAIEGSTVKGSFSYFSANTTTDLGPTSVTGFYSGVDAPSGGYTVYQIGGLNGWTARVATDDASLNSILIAAGGTGSTVAQNITWATNTNSVFVNSGTTIAALFSYYIGGNFTTFSGASQNRLIRLNTDGSKDTSFNIGTGFNSQVTPIAIQSDEKIFVGGQFTAFTGTSQFRLIRLNTDGSKDTSFDTGTGFTNDIISLAIQSDGKILVGGAFVTFSGASQNKLIRLNSDGSKDTSFNIGTGFSNTVRSVVVQSDGKILVGGDFTTFSGISQNRLIRLNTDGSKDTSFDIGSGFNNLVGSFAIQSDGKILAGGSFTTFTGATQNYLIRLNTDGSKDTSFDMGTGFNFGILSLAIQSDGKVLAGGSFTAFTGTSQFRLIRLNSDGSKDTSFDVGTGFNSFVRSIKVQSDEKILVGGSFTTFTGATQNYLIRLNTNGSKDTSFNIGTGFDTVVQTVVIKQ
jgi:uncharacterized delta-60 repeat protein